MPAFENPALRSFVENLGARLVFAQVRIDRLNGEFEFRHVADVARPAAELRVTKVSELRKLAQFTANGEYRPLKSAPTLIAGWRCECQGEGELGEALDHLYPGAVADWYAARAPVPPTTSLRDYAAQQSGMYRITTTLPDEIAARVIRDTCDARHCLKQRLWVAPNLEVDMVAGKSLIPCLEPCAIALEAIRKAARTELDRAAGRLPAPGQH